MKAIDLFPAAPDAAPSSERAPAAAARKSSASEQFQAVMGRALARSSHGTMDDSGSQAELRPGGRKPTSPKKSDPADAASSNAALCVENPHAPAPPPPGRDAASGATRSQANTIAAAEPADGKGQTAAATTTGPVNGDLAASLSPTDASLLDATGQGPTDQKSDSAVSSDGKALQEGQEIEANGRSSPAPQPGDGESAGISGANYSLPMQKAEKTNDSSSPTEQNLPVTADIHSGSEVAAKAARAAKAAALQDKSEISAAPDSSISSTTSPDGASPINSIAAQWPSPARSLERAHDLMSLHACRLRDSGADSLQVVIKPGQGLQLSLNLQMRDGNVEMQALLQRGNYEFLNLHWPELQQQLEARGVRLAALSCGDQPANGDANHFQQPGQEQSGEKPARAGAFAGFALNSTLVPTTAAKGRPAAPRGWESWA